MSNQNFFLCKLYLNDIQKKTYTASFCLTKANKKEDYITFENCLDESEEFFLNKIKYTHRKETFLLGRFAAKMSANLLLKNKDITNISIDYGVFNYPVIQTNTISNYDLSISHCENIGVSIVFENKILLGIDIEKIKDLFLEDCNVFFTEKEKDLIKTNNNRIVISTMIWTAKEALSKAIKTGLNVSFSILEVNCVTKIKNGYISNFSCFPQFKAVSIITKKYVFTIVIPNELHIETNFLLMKNFVDSHLNFL